MTDGEPEQQRRIAGRYRLRAVLGHGAMGTVWSGYDELLHRAVAIKEVRLPAGFPTERAPEVRERALREARAIAVLSHPNVITVHDVARQDGEPFVVMELLPSCSLAALLRAHGSLRVAQVAAVADAVAAALQAAHDAGITHRDVKPGNVLVAESATSYAAGRIKLTDFGIARNMADMSMTRTGIMLGSPAYMAPEVATGNPATPAADLWSLGATMFAATEGVVPYDADGDALNTVLSVVHGDVPTPSPGPLAPLIEGLMVKDPAGRMPLAELRHRLHPLLPEPAADLFGAEMFTEVLPKPAGASDPSATQVIRHRRHPSADNASADDADEPDAAPLTSGDAAGNEGDTGTGSAAGPPLAAEPGPLPFTPRTPPPRRRGPVTTVLLIGCAVLLFLAAASGGFATARLLGQQPLMPPQRAGDTAEDNAPRIDKLTTRTGQVTALKGSQGGQYRVRIPENWRRFRGRAPSPSLPTSTTVRYVSRDGRQTVTIERFREYFPKYSIDDYLDALRSTWPENDLRVRDNRTTGAGPRGSEATRELSYRTIERAGSGTQDTDSQVATQRRSHFAQAFRRGSELWVLTVTVPAEQEEFARESLYARIAPSLQLTD